MTSQRDIERLLDLWLAEGPNEVHDRVVEHLSERIGRQQQLPAWRVHWRESSVNGYLKPALAAAAVVIVVFAGIALLGRPFRPDIGSPTASPTSTVASPSPTGSSSAVCEDDLPGCAGPLAAGTHGSSLFGPRLIRYTTPDGWVNSIDTATIYKLDAPDGKTSILLWADVSIADQTPTSCAPVALAGGESPSAAEWMAYLTSHPGLVTTTPEPVDLPGDVDANAQSVDIAVDPGWTQTCPGGSGPEVQFIAHTAQPAVVYGVTPSDRLRLIALDSDSYGQSTVLILVYGPRDDRGFSAAVNTARSVVDTFVFGCGPRAGFGPCSNYPFTSPTSEP